MLSGDGSRGGTQVSGVVPGIQGAPRDLGGGCPRGQGGFQGSGGSHVSSVGCFQCWVRRKMKEDDEEDEGEGGGREEGGRMRMRKTKEVEEEEEDKS